jgi:ubiquinone/menaquinone biosynthesis C-methylase UbiE
MYNGAMSKDRTILRTRQNYDRLSRWYDLFSSAEQRFAQTGITLLNLQRNERVLEIGFGTGHALINLADSVGSMGRVYGIDLSPGMGAAANRRIHSSGKEEGISIQLGNASFLPYPEQSFHAAFMSFILELFSERKIPFVLSECRRILVSGGKLGVVSLAKKETRSVEIYEWFHLRFPYVVDCRPINIHPFLEEGGFKIINTITGVLWGLPVEAVVARKS